MLEKPVFSSSAKIKSALKINPLHGDSFSLEFLNKTTLEDHKEKYAQDSSLKLPEKSEIFKQFLEVIFKIIKFPLNHPFQCFVLLAMIQNLLKYVNVVNQKQIIPDHEFDEFSTDASFFINEDDYYKSAVINIPVLSKEPLNEFIVDERSPNKKGHRTQLYRETLGYFARGDTNPPETFNYTIRPVCPPFCGEIFKSNETGPPHYDVIKHRGNTWGSGFVSLTDNMAVARHFGYRYGITYRPFDTHYIYIVEMAKGIWFNDTSSFKWEAEHSAIGVVPIVSYRQCKNQKENPKSIHCGNIFIKRGLNLFVRDNILKAQLLPSEPYPVIDLAQLHYT